MPRSLDVICRNEAVEMAKAGDKVSGAYDPAPTVASRFIVVSAGDVDGHGRGSS